MDELTRLLLEGRSGNRAALGAWIRETQADVRRLCAALVDPAEADDLTQETYLRAHGAMHRFRADSSARTWLLAIARNVSVDAIRRRQRSRRLLRRLDLPEPIPADDGAESADLVRRLDPDRRQAFVLTQLMGLSYHEAALVCACPVGTIRSRVARARADLIALLADEGEALGS